MSLSPTEFVEIWQSSSSAREAAERLGISRGAARFRAVYLRKKGIPLKQTQETERLRGGGSTAGGAAGTSSNLPSYAASGAGGSNSNYNRTSTQTDFGVDKTVQRTKVAPGQINRLLEGQPDQLVAFYDSRDAQALA